MVTMTNQVMVTGEMAMTLREKILQNQKTQNKILFLMTMIPRVNSRT